VDYEPVAYHHAQEPRDRPHATIIQADIRHPDAILNHPETRELLDFTQPLGLPMVRVLLFVGPDDRPGQLVGTYRRQLAPGSYLDIFHLTDEHAHRSCASRSPP
jgi:hypothetical protein